MVHDVIGVLQPFCFFYHPKAPCRQSLRQYYASSLQVFTDSEVVSLVAKNTPVDKIIHGIHRSIANRVWAIAHDLDAEGEVVMTVTVAKNRGVVVLLEKGSPGPWACSASPRSWAHWAPPWPCSTGGAAVPRAGRPVDPHPWLKFCDPDHLDRLQYPGTGRPMSMWQR